MTNSRQNVHFWKIFCVDFDRFFHLFFEMLPKYIGVPLPMAIIVRNIVGNVELSPNFGSVFSLGVILTNLTKQLRYEVLGMF